MSLILRVDVDKPYGRHNIIRKIASKLKEDFLTKLTIKWGYLSHLNQFLRFCNQKNVSGHFYFRLCTAPDRKILSLMKQGNHVIGLHLENSRNIGTVKQELEEFQKFFNEYSVNTFSKHGSGTYKLGKNHYPPYEPWKYKKWAEELGIRFHSGNGIAEKEEDLHSVDGYFENLFWLEPDYRNPNFCRIDDLIEVAKNHDVVILIHPSNFVADQNTRTDFEKLVQSSKNRGVEWKLF
jgi:hypothetical protein